MEKYLFTCRHCRWYFHHCCACAICAFPELEEKDERILHKIWWSYAGENKEHKDLQGEGAKVNYKKLYPYSWKRCLWCGIHGVS